MADLNAIIIQRGQLLVTIDRYESNRAYVGDSNFYGEELTMNQILDDYVDHATHVMRMVVGPKKTAIEDITEEVAQAWLERTDAENGDTDFNAPLFVVTSEAYRVWNQNPEPYVNHHKQYGTVNHEQTGVGR